VGTEDGGQRVLSLLPDQVDTAPTAAAAEAFGSDADVELKRAFQGLNDIEKSNRVGRFGEGIASGDAAMGEGESGPGEGLEDLAEEGFGGIAEVREFRKSDAAAGGD
jgi:hypothetical protein